MSSLSGNKVGNLMLRLKTILIAAPVVSGVLLEAAVAQASGHGGGGGAFHGGGGFHLAPHPTAVLAFAVVHLWGVLVSLCAAAMIGGAIAARYDAPRYQYHFPPGVRYSVPSGHYSPPDCNPVQSV
jgi:hypothetical protein